MSRTILPFATSDVSQFAKVLRTQLGQVDGLPSHVQLLNMICRAAGHGNFQSFRAAAMGTAPLEPVAEAAGAEQPKPAVGMKAVQRVVRCFDAEGRLLRWPSRRSDQVLALWGLWASIPARTRMSELDVSGKIRQLHHFGDHALLRRELCDLGLMVRTPDGRVYRRVEKPVTGDAATLLAELGASRAAEAG